MKQVWIFIIVGLIAIAAYELSGGLHALVLHPFARPHRSVTLDGSQLLGAQTLHGQGTQQIYTFPFLLTSPTPQISAQPSLPVCDKESRRDNCQCSANEANAVLCPNYSVNADPVCPDNGFPIGGWESYTACTYISTAAGHYTANPAYPTYAANPACHQWCY